MTRFDRKSAVRVIAYFFSGDPSECVRELCIATGRSLLSRRAQRV